jgi:hypothetical protein
MRLITFILCSGIALTWIPACASAQKITYGEGTVKHSEGNVDCNHVYPTAYSSGSAPSQKRAYGSLWRPSRTARQSR